MNIKTQKNFTKDYTVNWSGEVSAIKKSDWNILWKRITKQIKGWVNQKGIII